MFPSTTEEWWRWVWLMDYLDYTFCLALSSTLIKLIAVIVLHEGQNYKVFITSLQPCKGWQFVIQKIDFECTITCCEMLICYRLIAHQLLNESFTTQCVKYFIISNFELQPKDYDSLMLQNVHSIEQKVWRHCLHVTSNKDSVLWDCQVGTVCLHTVWGGRGRALSSVSESQSHSFCILLPLDFRSAKPKEVLGLDVLPCSSGENTASPAQDVFLKFDFCQEQCFFPPRNDKVC